MFHYQIAVDGSVFHLPNRRGPPTISPLTSHGVPPTKSPWTTYHIAVFHLINRNGQPTIRRWPPCRHGPPTITPWTTYHIAVGWPAPSACCGSSRQVDARLLLPTGSLSHCHCCLKYVCNKCVGVIFKQKIRKKSKWYNAIYRLTLHLLLIGS